MKHFSILLLTVTVLSHAKNPKNTTWLNAFVDSSGNIWSDTLPGLYANCKKNLDRGCIFDSTAEDTEAARACKEIGGTLPSWSDFRKLDSAEMRNLANGSDVVFWTSTVATYKISNLEMFDVAFVFHTDDSLNVDGKDRSEELDVRCIIRL